MAERAHSFCIEETSFRLEPEEAERLELLLEALVAVIDACRADGQVVMRHSALDVEEVVPGVHLCDILYSAREELLIDTSVRQAAMLAIDRCVHWDERGPTPATIAVELDGKQFPAHTLAHAHERTLNHEATACIPLCDRSSHRGLKVVVRDRKAADIHFVRTDTERRQFYREIPEVNDLSPDDYMAHAALAFPDLWFAPELASQFRRFSRPYREIRSRVSHHLAGLNDHFRRVFEAEKHQPDPTYRVMDSKFGVRMSMESPKTRANKKAMSERMIVVDGVRVSCEWHTKLDYETDRIHFHPGKPDVARGQIMVGLFTGHFTT